ncbi:hypothetical protein FA95DRAFT_1550168 [Auriscalpium vulgare]|uniref:Uncharacterized protein n=1 Tax=Auriscalpium vulgare TaxID=40419 RepID=A0ACB8R7E9_9AGAM|nr:hypothetical protein FA95DRAFT_1550168 [Auriscalpium vulgare]
MATPQAGPLPSKRGEIGYVDDIHGQEEQEQRSGSPEQDALPARHPADHTPAPSVNGHGPFPAAPTVTITAPSASTDSLSTAHSTAKRSFLKPQNIPKYWGIRLDTILILFVQLLVFFGTIGAWVVTALVLSKKIGHTAPAPTQSTTSPDSSTDNTGDTNAGSSAIFVHVAFGIFVLAQLVFVERRIFRIRAERYMYLHPGEVLPSSLRRTTSARTASMGMAPWQRPPLPTYAAALAQDGFGTGDVEDSIIAQPPPPAYGKTRGSTLVLAGFLRNSLRVQAREHEADRPNSEISLRTDRPVSFRSIDEDWETRRDADRARRVEETLAALELREAGPVSDRR